MKSINSVKVANFVKAKKKVPTVHIRMYRPTWVWTGIIACATLIIWLINLAVGDYPLSITQVLRVLAGGGEAIERLVVIDWRLARSLVALVIGMALGISGAITQRIAHNGLASPDILGISRGASFAAVCMIAFSGGASTWLNTYIGVPLAALCGGLVTAAVIWALSRSSEVDTLRLVLIGIGINALLQAGITYMLVATDLNTATAARVWMMGTLNARTFEHLWPTFTLLCIAICVLLRQSIALPVIELGSESAQALGVSLRRVHAILLITSVVLAAVTVSAVGPVGFVAFAAPQIAARLTRLGNPPLALSAAVGAFLMLFSDFLAREAFPWEVPVGIVTSAVGGPFLVWLLLRHTSLSRSR